MPAVSLQAFDVVGHNLYAKQTVKGYSGNLTTVVKTFQAGQLIGNIYSWIERPDGIYFMFYASAQDYANFNPFYVKMVPAQLNFPDGPGILAAKAAALEQKKKEEEGLFQYYFEKYAPWLVGAGVVAIALPSVVRSARKSVVSGMGKNDAAAAALIIGALALVSFTGKKKKRKGSVIVGPLDEGEFLDDDQYMMIPD